MTHKAGFVSIIGKPNAGKSTLMNQLVGEKMAIITPKAQTTRHRILGIVNEENYQIVFSDTPGVIKPNYKLQESMMHFVDDALVDADILVFVTDINEKQDEEDVSFQVRPIEFFNGYVNRVEYQGPRFTLIEDQRIITELKKTFLFNSTYLDY